jgi:hypothetical protein
LCLCFFLLARVARALTTSFIFSFYFFIFHSGVGVEPIAVLSHNSLHSRVRVY